MSADDMMALMNNHELLMAGSTQDFDGLHRGGNRDADGTVDRVRDPPKELLPLLKKIKRVIDMELIDIHQVLKEQGATPYGTFMKSRFNSTLTIIFKSTIIFSHEDLFALDSAYGTGAPDLQEPGTFEYIAWLDFVEDILQVDASFMPADQAPPLGFKPKPMSAIAMMLDAMDGKMDGVVDDTKLVDGMSKGKFLGDHDGLDSGEEQQAIIDASRNNSHAAFGGSFGKAGKVAVSQTGATRNNAR